MLHETQSKSNLEDSTSEGFQKHSSEVFFKKRCSENFRKKLQENNLFIEHIRETTSEGFY